MNNKTLKKHWLHKSVRETQLKKIEASIEVLVKKRRKTQDLINIISKITEWHQDIPISKVYIDNIYGKEMEIGRRDEEKRLACIYPNAHTSKDGVAETWGIRVNDYSKQKPKYYGGKYLGANFSWEQAQEIAMDWIVNGELPTEKGF